MHINLNNAMAVELEGQFVFVSWIKFMCRYLKRKMVVVGISPKRLGQWAFYCLPSFLLSENTTLFLFLSILLKALLLVAPVINAKRIIFCSYEDFLILSTSSFKFFYIHYTTFKLFPVDDLPPRKRVQPF